MRVILCNLQLFSCDQMIYIFEDGQEVHAQKVDIEDVVPAICVLAEQFDTTEVKIHSQAAYAHAWAEQIKTAYSMNYSNKTINVEVI